MSEVYCRRSCDLRYSGLRWDGGWVAGYLAIWLVEPAIGSAGADEVTAAAAAELAHLIGMRISC